MVKRSFFNVGTICEKMMGVSKGVKSLGSGFPIGGEQHPYWHTILLAKSSVLYLWRPLTLERGCPTPDRHFSVEAEQADFVG